MRTTLRKDLETVIGIPVTPSPATTHWTTTAYVAVLDHLTAGGVTAIVPLDQEESDEPEKLRAAWRVSALIDGNAEASGAHI